MTEAERKAAAEVMASDGPWEYRYRLANYDPTKWIGADDNPAWNWREFDYRVKPQKIVRYFIIPSLEHGFPSAKAASAAIRGTHIACVRIEFTEGQFDE